MNDPKADEVIIQALTVQFHGLETDTYDDHLTSFYMTQRICNLAYHDWYFCYMQNLLIGTWEMNDHE